MEQTKEIPLLETVPPDLLLIITGFKLVSFALRIDAHMEKLLRSGASELLETAMVVDCSYRAHESLNSDVMILFSI